EPELRAVFEEFEMIKCSDSGAVSCIFKDRLKRGVITEHNFEWYFAAYLEGDLDLGERKMVEAFASASPSMRQELDHMLKTRLQPDVTLVFENKELLKRPVILPLYKTLVRYSGAAAAVLVLFFVGFLLMRQSEPSGNLGNQTPPQQVINVVAPNNLAVGTLPDPLTVPESQENHLPADFTPSKPDASTLARSTVEELYLAYFPMPFTAIRLAPISGEIAHSNPVADLIKEPRNEIALLQISPLQYGLLLPDQDPEQALPGNVRNTFQRTLAEDISRIEDRLSANRPHSILALAGASLLELNRLVGSPIQVQTQFDENGKTVQLFVGNIEFSRRTR
ncbi:MAG TPA: hypothetical protein VLH61_12055, partial [Bacteroidales bacterium]|nr:hypothetical protein [Bacteroidales bacterium]